jgi:hypothetical protein
MAAQKKNEHNSFCLIFPNESSKNTLEEQIRNMNTQNMSKNANIP